MNWLLGDKNIANFASHRFSGQLIIFGPPDN